jgi:hypothetical protein
MFGSGNGHSTPGSNNLGHLPVERSMKYYVTKKEKNMSNHKTVITRGQPKRKVIGFVHCDGRVILGFQYRHLPDQHNCILQPSTGIVTTNGGGYPETMGGYPEESTIYEGDSVTIQF